MVVLNLMHDPLVVNVILNTNRRDLTLACLESLGKSTYKNQHSIVLDNASTDGSVEAINLLYPQVEVIGLAENKGYAGNNNVGIQRAVEQGADWIFVLNEDIILAPDCLSLLIQTAESDPQIGIVGPLVYHYDEPNVIQSAGGSLDYYWRSIHLGQNEIDQGQFSDPRKVDWISGCAILVRREVIEHVGVLDERFFYYWEETEWCYRARAHGWIVILVSGAKIWHKGVQRNYKPGPDVTYYATRNHYLLMAKHRAPLRAWVYNGIQNIRSLCSWTIKPKWFEMHAHRQALWQALIDFTKGNFGKRSQPREFKPIKLNKS
jgi:GT2 family glycosyltransferase